MSVKIIACTTNSADVIGVTMSRTSCWIHVMNSNKVRVRALAKQLIDKGCRHFAVSGRIAESVHDDIDDVVESMIDSTELVLTTWHHGGRERVAREFFDVDCPNGITLLRVIVVIGRDCNQELGELSKLVAAVSEIGS